MLTAASIISIAVLWLTTKFTAFPLANLILLFVLGTIIGSYLNVASFRYSPEKGFGRSLRGRSLCPYCKKELRWYELIPVVSFLIQAGRCRECGGRLSLQYPVVEILGGLALVFVYLKLGFSPLALLWALVFLTLILISVIDLRLRIIPDKLTIFIVLIAGAVTALNYIGGVSQGSFFGHYSFLFIWSENFWFNRLVGIAFGLVFFGLIHFLTRGKAMGFGDVKLAGALGFLLGWPDILLALLLAFIAGSAYAVPLLLIGRKKMKEALPFGPFIVTGVTLVFFFGYHILNGYFGLFGF